MLISDKRGHAPLGYARPEHWPMWVRFLELHKGKFWAEKGREGEWDNNEEAVREAELFREEGGDEQLI